MFAPSLSAAASPSLQVGQANASLLIARHATSRIEQSMTRLFIHKLYTIRCTETVRIVSEEKHVRNRVPIRRLDSSTASCCFTDLPSEKAFSRLIARIPYFYPHAQDEYKHSQLWAPPCNSGSRIKRRFTQPSPYTRNMLSASRHEKNSSTINRMT